MRSALITQAEVFELLRYDLSSGLFYWAKDRSRQAKSGCIAGYIDKHGYSVLKINGARYQAHRLVWLWVHGVFPKGQIDHINRIKTDNRIVNLRAVTSAENMQNLPVSKRNTSGHMGVHLYKKTGRFRVNIRVGGVQKHIGYFKNMAEARNAYEKAKMQFHPNSCNDINVKPDWCKCYAAAEQHANELQTEEA